MLPGRPGRPVRHRPGIWINAAKAAVHSPPRRTFGVASPGAATGRGRDDQGGSAARRCTGAVGPRQYPEPVSAQPERPEQPKARTSRAARGEPAGGGYSARHLSVLEGLEAVRKRPGMYIGSTDSRGLMHCLWEILDNAVDEALGGWCTRIDVILREDGSVEVHDNGRGIPVDVEPRTKLTGVEVVMTKLHAGGKFGGGSYNATGGLHGVGASRGQRPERAVRRGGRPGGPDPPDLVPPGRARASSTGRGRTPPFSRKSGLQAAGTCPRSKTGTRVRFWPDARSSPLMRRSTWPPSTPEPSRRRSWCRASRSW